MKCPHCNGEVKYNQITCPYCGKENEEAIEFLGAVQQKIERNRLLGPFLRRMKRPELALRVVERVAVILLLLNVLLVAGCFLFHDFVVKKPANDSYAKIYVNDFESKQTYHFGNFHESVKKYLEWEEGDAPLDEYFFDDMFRDAYLALAKADTDELWDEYYLFATAFFQGYLGMTKEQCAFLIPADGEYERYPGSTTWTTELEAVMQKVQGVE